MTQLSDVESLYHRLVSLEHETDKRLERLNWLERKMVGMLHWTALVFGVVMGYTITKLTVGVDGPWGVVAVIFLLTSFSIAIWMEWRFFGDAPSYIQEREVPFRSLHLRLTRRRSR